MSEPSIPATSEAPEGWLAWLRRELAPTPGRSRNTVRIAVTVMLVVILSMTLQVPGAAISAYMVIFITKNYSKTTVIVGVLGIIGITLAIALSLLLYHFTLDRPELRIPGMALSIFLGFWFLRICTIGPLAFLLAFVLSFTQSLAELSPNAELMVRALLWGWVLLCYPMVITVVVSEVFLPVASPQKPAAAKKKEKKPLFKPDTFTNPAYALFAAKVTLAGMFCYILYTAVDWAGIHTAMITCMIIAVEDTTKSTLYKGLLRIIGCLIGALLGFLTIMYLIPHMETIASLSLLMGAVTLLAAWIGQGSERISYAGLQISLAYYMTVLQGYGPGTDFDTMRDRVVGILLGIVVMTVVFCYLWPDRPESRKGFFRVALSRS